MSGSGNASILVKDLVKSYQNRNDKEDLTHKSTSAIDHINFKVRKGEIYAILGANGAGKSTTLRILSTLMKPDQGEVTICGISCKQHTTKIREKIGVVFQESILDDSLKAVENLKLRGQLYGLSGDELEQRIQWVAGVVGATELYHRTYGTLSGGEKRRIDIARALLHKPEVLLLDEPTNGLDPGIRKEIWDILCFLQQRHHMTIVFSTHHMEEVMRANKVMILRYGKVAACGSPGQLQAQYTANLLYMRVTQPFRISTMLKKAGYVVTSHNQEIKVTIKDSKEAVRILEMCQDSLIDFEVKKSTMEDVFMEVLGENE